MKEKQFACFILGMAIFACFFGIMKMQTKLQDARKRSDSAKTTAENTNRQRVVATSNFANLQKKSEGEIAYYEIWKPYFDAYPDGQTVIDRFLDHMKEEGKIEPFRQQMSNVAYKDKHGTISKLQRINLTCVDEYAVIFNWLGDVEREFPTSRITSCEVSKAQGDSDIRMILTVDIPLTSAADKSAT